MYQILRADLKCFYSGIASGIACFCVSAVILAVVVAVLGIDLGGKQTSGEKYLLLIYYCFTVAGVVFCGLWIPMYVRRRIGYKCESCGCTLSCFYKRPTTIKHWNREWNELNEGRCPKCGTSLLGLGPLPHGRGS